MAPVGTRKAAPLVPVKAVATFHYDGRAVRAGERIAMRATEAAAAHRLGYVSLTRPPRNGRAPEPQTPAPDPEKRRRYKRRDLEPEP
jgi:hypothetical protein